MTRQIFMDKWLVKTTTATMIRLLKNAQKCADEGDVDGILKRIRRVKEHAERLEHFLVNTYKTEA